MNKSPFFEKYGKFVNQYKAMISEGSSLNDGSDIERLKEIKTILQKNIGAAQFCTAIEQEELAKIINTKFSSDLEMMIDAEPFENGTCKTQDQWIEIYNKLPSGRDFASMSDYDKEFKRIVRDLSEGTTEEKKKAQKQLASYRKDFQESLIVGTPRIKYSVNSDNAEIIHNYNSKHRKTIPYSVEVPVFRDKPIEEVANDEKGLKFLQTFFDTEDDAETIIKRYEVISGKTRDKIKVWTADKDTRKTHPERAAFLNCNSSEFHIFGINLLSSGGRSRGVSYSPR